jgi:hypothetical protein
MSKHIDLEKTGFESDDNKSENNDKSVNEMTEVKTKKSSFNSSKTAVEDPNLKAFDFYHPESVIK